MVILLCSTPRRGVIAVATHGTPNGYGVPSSTFPFADDDVLEKNFRLEEKNRDEFDSNEGTGHRRSRSPTKKMTATPTYGHSCYPFAVNCRFSKTFIGVPKKCGYCQKIIVATGFACQNCRFRCHKRCIMIGRGPQVCLRPKPCSLSRLPPGDEAIISKLLKENEINSNDMDSVFAESEQEYEESLVDVMSEVMISEISSCRQSRPSWANSSSYGGVRSLAPSLTTSEEPLSSLPPSPQPSASPPVSNPSSPIYPADVMGSHKLCPPPRHRQRQLSQQQRNTNMLLLALAAGVERRPSPTGSTSSSRQPAVTPTPRPTSATNSGFMDKFFKLFPSWSSSNKEGSNSNNASTMLETTLKTTPRSSSVASAASSVSMATYSESYEKEAKQLIPRTVSASGAVASIANGGTKRPHTLSACSASSNNGCSGGANSRTPVDEFNHSILEDLFASSQVSSGTNPNGCNNATGGASRTKTTQFLRRRLLWAKHIAGERTSRSQDCVTVTDVGRREHLAWNAIRARSATVRAGVELNPSGQDESAITSDRRLDNQQSTAIFDEGRLGDEREETIEEIQARERLANTWPLSGLHINHDDAKIRKIDGVDARVNENFEIGDGHEFGDEDGFYGSLHRHERISDLGEWAIPYDDLEFVECLYECRSMATFKGRWHGDVMIHTFDMSGAERDRLMQTFLDDVRTLTKIRHENVALFMGTSIDAPRVAVVTSIRKGVSLYDAMQVENRRLSQHAVLNIVRQVAQGMGYLHAKGIVLKTLTSKSIYLECKVKISMLDDGAPLKKHDVGGVGCVRRGHLTYLSPELMKTIRVDPPAVVVAAVMTKESDVYAFGTILYELCAGDYPFAQLPPEAVVWAIGTGQRQDLERVRCNVAMKSLIEDCWSPDPTYRPSFAEVLKELQHTAALRKKHTSSVPEKLNKAGLHRSPYNY